MTSRTSRRELSSNSGKLLLAGALTAILLCLFFPGSYSQDSWKQCQQAISGQYDDWYGVGLSFLWHLLYRLTGQYASLYVAQMLFYGWFIYLLISRMAAGSYALWVMLPAAVLFCFIPQYVMRDSLLCVLWGVGVLLLLNGSRAWMVPAFLLLIYGLGVRTNALAGLLPLGWIAVYVYSKGRHSFWLWCALTFMACALVFISGQFFTYKIVKAARAYPDYKLKLLDIAGISRLSGQDYFPACVETYPGFSYETVMKEYTPASFDDLYWRPTGKTQLFPRPDDAVDSCVHRGWQKAIGQHPFLYMENRAEGFLYYLRIRKRLPDTAYWNVIITPKRPAAFIRLYTWLGRTPFFSPWFWLLANGIGALFFFLVWGKVKTRRWRFHSWIQLSGLLFGLSQFPVYQIDQEFRYSYWNIFVFLIGLAGLLEWLTRASPRSVSPSGPPPPSLTVKQNPVPL